MLETTSKYILSARNTYTRSLYLKLKFYAFCVKDIVLYQGTTTLPASERNTENSINIVRACKL